MSQNIDKLEANIRKLPPDQQEKLRELVRETREREREIKQTTKEAIQELDTLRLYLKYSVFDWEASQREFEQRRTANG